MRRARALPCVAAALLLAVPAGAAPPAGSPFPEVPAEIPPHPSYRWAYASLLVGAGLVGGSFVISRRADDTYREYLDATDPDRIERLYDRTVFEDRAASAALLGGEALFAFGVYLRFIRHPAPRRVGLILSPGACAFSLRF